jgi:NTE family protein
MFLEETGGHVSPHFMMISVNASTNRYSEMDLSNRTPSLPNTITAMSNTQIHRTNAATLELMEDTVEQWAVELSTPESPTQPYFVEIAFDGIEDDERRDWFNQIPTGLSLSDEEVDGLIQVGRELLLNHPEFRRFMASVGRD